MLGSALRGSRNSIELSKWRSGGKRRRWGLVPGSREGVRDDRKGAPKKSEKERTGPGNRRGRCEIEGVRSRPRKQKKGVRSYYQ